MVSSTQAVDTLYPLVEEGKGRPRRFGFSAPVMPWIQRRAIVMVQPPGESVVRCRIDTYSHKKSGRTLQGMRTAITCTELGTHIPTGSPYVEQTPSTPAWQAKLNSIAPNASATYRSESTSVPTVPKIGDYWYQTDTQLTKRYDGTDWQNVGTSPFNESADTGVAFETANEKVKIKDDGTIEAVDGKFSGSITSGTITGTTITATDITVESIKSSASGVTTTDSKSGTAGSSTMSLDISGIGMLYYYVTGASGGSITMTINISWDNSGSYSIFDTITTSTTGTIGKWISFVAGTADMRFSVAFSGSGTKTAGYTWRRF